MILLLSGEGSSDIGSCQTATGTCEGADFKPGPMTLLIDKLVEPHWDYSPLNASSCVFISEDALTNYCRSQRMGTTLPGKKKAVDTGYFFKNARGLARLAKDRSARDDCPVGAVLFRDSDGTVASHRSLWNDKVRSMEAGFAAEDFDLGVPMVPKPKSEAWLLCAVQANQYQNCARFEGLSGNDASPKSAKKELASALAARDYDYNDVCEMVESGEINPQQIQMPSFNYFKNRLETVAQQMVAR
ncbi:MAG TPA: hypothetical protein VMH30_05860 [Verrucomicrobiae bacterium]|nr:hypothetical protein [Verrucomicrobiae bacterium]